MNQAACTVQKEDVAQTEPSLTGASSLRSSALHRRAGAVARQIALLKLVNIER